MRKLIPLFIKPVIRFLYYRQERAKAFREPGIRKAQDEHIKQYDASTRKLIVFLIAGADYDTGIDKISGGIISIVSLCEESKKLKVIHGAEVIMCTLPHQHLLLKHTQFKNDTYVFRFDQLKKYFTQSNEILLHIPEFLCTYFQQHLNKSEKVWLKRNNIFHINILNQNIRLMPAREELENLKNFASQVTITTAHQQYCNRSYRDLYDTPLHKFSVWISPEKYLFKKYTAKQNLIIVSPDIHPMKQVVMDKLATIPGLKIQVIQNLTYEQYKETIACAKWAITFGEGLDGYIIEPIFSGAIGFAVYNDDFFTTDFKGLSTIYSSYELMLNTIVSNILSLDNDTNFLDYQKMQYDVCAKHYSHAQYSQNIASFYRGEYTLQ